MSGLSPVIPRGGRLVALLGVVLIALTYRTGVAVIGPVFAAISDELGMGVIVLSLIAAAPPVGFAAAGLIVPALTRRWGLEGTVVVSTALIIGAQVMRAFSGEAVMLVGSTFLVMLGVGVTNVLLPPIVRRYFPDRIAAATSAYLVLMGLGSAAAAFAGVPLAEGIGWRLALAAWALLSCVAVAPWIVMWRPRRDAGGVDPVPEFEDVVADRAVSPRPRRSVARPRVSRSPTAWALAAVLGLSSLNIYAAIAFVPSMLVAAAGLTPTEAGFALGLMSIVGVPGGLVVPLLATRPRAVAPMIAFAGACAVVAWGGMIVAPAAAPLLWAVLIGAIPITFPLALVLVTLRSRAQPVTVALSSFVQGLAYIAAGLFALALGALHDLTGGWTASMILLMLTAVLAVPSIAVLRRPRIVDDEIPQLDGVRAPR